MSVRRAPVVAALLPVPSSPRAAPSSPAPRARLRRFRGGAPGRCRRPPRRRLRDDRGARAAIDAGGVGRDGEVARLRRVARPVRSAPRLRVAGPRASAARVAGQSSPAADVRPGLRGSPGRRRASRGPDARRAGGTSAVGDDRAARRAAGPRSSGGAAEGQAAPVLGVAAGPAVGCGAGPGPVAAGAGPAPLRPRAVDGTRRSGGQRVGSVDDRGHRPGRGRAKPVPLASPVLTPGPRGPIRPRFRPLSIPGIHASIHGAQPAAHTRGSHGGASRSPVSTAI